MTDFQIERPSQDSPLDESPQVAGNRVEAVRLQGVEVPWILWAKAADVIVAKSDDRGSQDPVAIHRLFSKPPVRESGREALFSELWLAPPVPALPGIPADPMQAHGAVLEGQLNPFAPVEM